MSTDSVIKRKSMDFAKRIVRLYQYLVTQQHENVMSKQILRSGPSIGANIAEAVYGSSRRDFTAKLQIARKEAAETLYWLELLNSCEYISDLMFDSMSADCKELLAMITASVKTIASQ